MSRSTSAAAPEAGALLNCLWTVRTVGNWMALGVCAYIQYLSLSINPIKNIQYMFFTLKGLSVLAIHCWAVGLRPYTVSSKDASLGIFLLMVLGHLKLWVDTARIALEFTFQTALVSYLDTLGYGYIQTYTQTLKFFYWELFKGKVGIGQTPIDSLFPDPNQSGGSERASQPVVDILPPLAISETASFSVFQIQPIEEGGSA
ncbi:hypothetical protein TrST_g7452 [Triparma strigata]|uniref:Uncharacterized protein n=1 Tax=Triparma strigata TaxID=1606541 RepID=A0A9W7EVL3_9STRA|nr:hypothetical protein TrST_g7452 [Triparma strigata]